MSVDSTRRVPTLWHGHGIARRMTARLTAGRTALVIADSAVAHPLPPGASLRTITVDARRADVSMVLTLAHEIALRRPEVVVAVGGGSVLDASKIAALALGPGRALDYAIGHASRSALTMLPGASAPVDLIAVPTTIGTSSETNSVGILKNANGYRLLIGDCLRPRHALIDPCNLATLTRDAVREGALEAFLRLAGAATGVGRRTRSDSDAVALGRALLETAARDSVTPAGRLRLARLSAATQRSAALHGPDRFSARHWYVANEVAFHLHVRKMAATAAVIAAVWRRICAGDARWGDRSGLEEFWAPVAHAVALPLDPPTGIAALLDGWAIASPPRPSARAIDRIAAAAEACWGRRRPMLPGLVAADFREVLHDARWTPRSLDGDGISDGTNERPRGGEGDGYRQ